MLLKDSVSVGAKSRRGSQGRRVATGRRADGQDRGIGDGL